MQAEAAAAAASPPAGPSEAAACNKDQLPCFVLLDDAWRGTSHLQEMFDSMQRPVYGVSLPQVCRIFTFLNLLLHGSGILVCCFKVWGWHYVKRGMLCCSLLVD